PASKGEGLSVARRGRFTLFALFLRAGTFLAVCPTKYLASLGSSVTFSHLVLSEKTLWPISAIGLSFGPPPTRIKPVNDVCHFQSGRGSTSAASLLGSTCVLRDGDRAWHGLSGPCRPQWCFPRAGHDEPGHQQDQFRASSTGSGFGTLGR